MRVRMMRIRRDEGDEGSKKISKQPNPSANFGPLQIIPNRTSPKFSVPPRGHASIDRASRARSWSFDRFDPSHSLTRCSPSAPLPTPSSYAHTHMHAIARPASASLRTVQRLLHTSAPVASSSGGGGGGSSSSSSSSSSSGASSSPKKPQQQAAKTSSPEPISPLNFDLSTFPSLLKMAHPILDSGIHLHTPGSASNPLPSSVSIYNEPRYFEPAPPSAASLSLMGDAGANTVDASGYLSTVTPLEKGEINALHRYTLAIDRVTKMTGKGKNSRMRALVVAGNGRGLVGVGEGKDLNAGKAGRKAFQEAVKNLDYVERYEGRTIAAETHIKFGATQVTLRPRPPGESCLFSAWHSACSHDLFTRFRPARAARDPRPVARSRHLRPERQDPGQHQQGQRRQGDAHDAVRRRSARRPRRRRRRTRQAPRQGRRHAQRARD